MAKTGILASLTAAQGILKSGYGTRELAVNANNIFGMKAELSGNNWPSDWGGQTYTLRFKNMFHYRKMELDTVRHTGSGEEYEY